MSNVLIRLKRRKLTLNVLVDYWGDYFGDNVTNNNKLGILVNMFNIGSIVSFFITPYVADHYGRKLAIVVGCLFMILGGCLSAFCNGYGSKYYHEIRALSLKADLL